jgi:ABC-type polysaccharide/polyol phosphate transport system ATPase subunit
VSNAAILAEAVSKAYPIYDSPGDRLRELFRFGRRGLARSFDALREISFEVERGTTFSIIGENGAGKSTLLQLIAGILQPTGGKLEVRGRVSALLELGSGFNPEFTGRDNVFLNASILGLSRREVEACYSEILDFAEIGDFIHRPVKTYSTGMVVRLAFAVAINVRPEILLVDEALAVGDIYFRQRCMRRIHQMQRAGVTIVYVTHNIADVKSIATRAMWLEHGRIAEIGDPDRVVSRYQAYMVNKDIEYVRHHPARPAQEAGLAPAHHAEIEIVETIPNIDFRYGTGRAKILGIAALSRRGEPLLLLPPGEEIIVRISVCAESALERPLVGFMLRNHMGVDFSGTNTALEDAHLPPLQPGEVATVDFRVQLPALYPGHFSFSPAVADGTLEAYEMCDWIDNALTLQMEKRVEMYGYFRLPCQALVKVGGVRTGLHR